MGAYENPGMVRDVSGQIINQGIAQIGKSFADAITTFATLKAQSGAAARKEAERVQRVGYQVESKAWDNANRNHAFVAKENPALSEQFGDTTGQLLRGWTDDDGTVNMGAIEAETILATNSGLSNDERGILQERIQRAKNFQNFGIAGGGKIISDLEDMDGVTASDLDSTHYWVGRTQLEQDMSMLTAYGLNNKELDGLTSIKKLVPGQKGEMIVRVTSKIEEGSKAWNDLSDLSKEEVRKNKGQLVWERNINEWDQGLIHKIPDGLDVDKIAMNSQFMTKQGKITNSYMKGGENANVTNYQPMPGKPGVEKSTTFNYVDVDKLINNDAFKGDINAKATVLEAMDPGELQAFVNKMGGLSGGPNAYKKNLEGKTKPERMAYLTEQLTQNFLGTKLGGITKRKATDQDVKNWQDNGFEGGLTKGVSEVYIQPVSSGQRNIPGYKSPGTPGNYGKVATTFVNDILADPESVIPRITKNTTSVFDKSTKKLTIKTTQKDGLGQEILTDSDDPNSTILIDKTFELGTAKGRQDFFALMLPQISSGSLSGGSAAALGAQDAVMKLAGQAMEGYDFVDDGKPTEKQTAIEFNNMLINDIKDATNIGGILDDTDKLNATKLVLDQYKAKYDKYKSSPYSEILLAIINSSNTADANVNKVLQQLIKEETPKKQ